MELRASFLRDLAAAGRAHHATLGPVALALEDAVARAGAAPWVDGAHFMTFYEGVLAALGTQGVHDVARGCVGRTKNGPLLGTFVRMARKLTSRIPAAMLRWYPPGRAMVMRGFGEAWFEAGDGGGAVVVRGCPVASSAAWRASTTGTLHGILDEIGCEGTVESTDNTAVDATFSIRWWRATAPRAA